MSHGGPACPAGEGLTQEVHPWLGAILDAAPCPMGQGKSLSQLLPFEAGQCRVMAWRGGKKGV